MRKVNSGLSKMSKKATDVIDRLLQVFECKNDSELCILLNVKSQSTLSSWRSRDSQFICNDGSVSASKMDCSTTFVAIKVEQRVVQCFLENRIISPQLARTNVNKLGNNNPDLP
jgi:hypothetical protein